MIEKVHVQFVETAAEVLRQGAVCRCVPRADKRVIPSRPVRIFQEQAGLRLAGSDCLDTLVAGNLGKCSSGLQAVAAEAQRIQFFGAIRQGGVEMPHQAAPAGNGNLPDAEPADDMVYPERVEIPAHDTQAALPPGVPVGLHGLPVVGGEAPVLAIGAEIIGRSPGRAVQVEQFRMEMGLGAVGTHANGQVAFEIDPVGTCITHLFAQLLIQMVLHPDIVFRLQAVAPGAECRILIQPEGVFGGKLPAGRSGQVPLTACQEGLSDPGHLGFGHTRPVNLREGVQGRLLGGESGCLADAQVLQAQVQRVQRKGRDGTVRVGILPFAAAGGVVHRQQLDDALAGCHRPIDQRPQIAKIADAEIVGGAQRENGYCGTGAAESRAVEQICLMRTREGAAGDGTVYPGVVATASGGDAGAMVMLPFRPPDQAVAQDHVGVVFQGCGRAIRYRNGPDAAILPCHRVLPSFQHHRQALTPFRHILNTKIHIIAFVLR